MTSRYYPILESYDKMAREILELTIATEADTIGPNPSQPTRSSASDMQDVKANVSTKSVKSTTERQLNGEIKNGQTQNMNPRNSTSDAADLGNKKVDKEISPADKTTLIEKIMKFFEMIGQMISNVIRGITNRVNVLAKDDKTFFKQLESQRAAVKPLKGFKATNWEYKQSEVDATIVRMGIDCNTAIRAFANLKADPTNQRVLALLNAKPEKIVEVFLIPYMKDKQNGYNMRAFNKELIDTFHGQKKEFTYSAEQIPKIMEVAQRTHAISSKVNGLTKECQNSLEALKAIKVQLRAINDEETLEKVRLRLSKATQLYNIYLTALKIYNELLVERSLSAKDLLRKFYQF